MRNLIQIVAVLAGSLFAPSAQASTFILSPETPGLTFAIENAGTVSDLYEADGVNDTYEFVLTLTTSTSYADNADADLLAAFSIDFGTSSPDAATLVSGPPGSSWSSAFVGLKVPGGSAKCNGSEAGSLCVEGIPSAAGNLAFDADAVYTWLFRIDLGAGGFGDTTTLTAAVATLKQTGASYVFHGDAVVSGATGSLAPTSSSERESPLSPIAAPEPGSLLLLGTGLVFAASRMRRVKH